MTGSRRAVWIALTVLLAGAPVHAQEAPAQPAPAPAPAQPLPAPATPARPRPPRQEETIPSFVPPPPTASLQPDAPARAVMPPASADEQRLTPIDLEGFLRGDGEGLTAEAVADRAVGTSPSIEATRAQAEQARIGVERAMIAFFPRLEFTGRYTRLSPVTLGQVFGFDPAVLGTLTPAQLETATLLGRLFGGDQANPFRVILDNWSFGAGITVPVSDIFLQVWPSYEAADIGAQASRHQVRVRASEIAQQAREAFYNYARARGALAVAQSAVSAVELQAQLIDAMVQAGTTAQVDLIRVQAQVAAARVAVLRTEAGARIAEVAVRTLMHTPSEDRAQLAIAEDLLEPLPAVSEGRDALTSRALERRAETQALRRLVHARSRMIDAAEGARWPHFAIAFNYAWQNPNQRIFPLTQEFKENWDLSAVLSWSPNDFFVAENRAAETRSQRTQAEADLSALEDGIRLQVTQAFENLHSAVAAIDAARQGVQAADETLRVRNEQYRAGATVVTELVLAVNERARAQLDLINAALDARVAYSQLRRSTGDDGPYAGVD